MLPRSWTYQISPKVLQAFWFERREIRALLHEAQLVIRWIPGTNGAIDVEFTFLPAESAGHRATLLPDAG